MWYLGLIAIFFTIYNIGTGLLMRAVGNKDANQCGLEAAIWFVAGCICFK